MIKSFKSIDWPVHQKQPNLRPIGEKMYRLEETARYNWVGVWKKKTGYFEIEIKEGFVSDGQSVPQVFWSFGLRPDGTVRMAALCHDGLYAFGGNEKHEFGGVSVWCDGKPVQLGRKASDQVYKASYIAANFQEQRKARLAYRALRMFGWVFFGDRLKNKD